MKPYPILKSKKAMLAAARRVIRRPPLTTKDAIDLAHTVVHLLQRKPKRKRK